MKATPHSNPVAAARKSRRRVISLGVAGLLVVGGILYFSRSAEPDRRAEALRLAKAGKLAEAEPLLLRVLDRDANDTEAVTALALAKLGGTDTAAAERYLSRWCELRPADAKPFQLRMDLRHRVARGKRIPADRVQLMDAAFTDGHRALELDPANDPIRREVVWLALNAGRHAAAEVESRRALASAPSDPWLNYLLAKSLHGQGKRTEAAAALDPVLRVQPNFADALLLRAILHHEGDQPALAVPLLRHALLQRECPRRDGLYRLGLALAATGKDEEARRALAEVELLNLNAAVENDQFPNNPAMRVQVAEAMLGMGRLTESNAELDAVLLGAPDFAPAHRVKALYHMRAGQPDKAAEHRRRAGPDVP